jgi:hypothetical protein
MRNVAYCCELPRKKMVKQQEQTDTCVFRLVLLHYSRLQLVLECYNIPVHGIIYQGPKRPNA